MRNVRRLFATILLVLALGAPVYAGDVPCPPAPPPPLPIAGSLPSGDNPGLAAAVPSSSETPTAPYSGLSQLAIDLIWGVLSIY